MKKTFVCLLGACLSLLQAHAAADFQVRNGIPNSRLFFQRDRVGNQYLFFIGGQVLKAAMLKNKNLRYSKQMIDAMKQYFPNAGMIEVRQPYEGGSHFALYRCCWARPIFGEMICSGHLAILDLAAEDRAEKPEIAARRVEELLRQIIRYRSTHSRIMIYTLTPEMLAAYRAGETPEYIERCEKIADYYGVPTLNLAQIAAKKIIAGELPESAFLTNGVEPTDAGAKVYAAAIKQFIDALMRGPMPEKLQRLKLPPSKDPLVNDNGRIIAYEDPEVKVGEGWKCGQKPLIRPFRHLLISDKPGSTLKLAFRGSEIGFIETAVPNNVDYEYSIDGAPFKKISLPPVQKPVMRPVYLMDGLAKDQAHQLTLRTVGEGKSRFGAFLLNGTVKNTYAGLSALQRIDAVYATMDPIKCTFAPDRFRYIPKTMKKLREGGTLRMVLLGDSIMGNTAASEFDLLLMRKFPSCKIRKIPSLRSSTGCNWYEKENRVESYVLRHHPDLLMIGGISNGGSAEPVRSVIRQVRAKQPDVEVLLITPVFGSLTRDDHIINFTAKIDPNKKSFRRGMRQVAAEEHCAFFDMTAPWWLYIQSTGKTPGWFMADAVHGNGRGCQIIGRLLEQWFCQP